MKNKGAGRSVLVYGPAGTGKTYGWNMKGVAALGQNPDDQFESIRAQGIKGPTCYTTPFLAQVNTQLEKLADSKEFRIVLVDDLHNLVKESLDDAKVWGNFQPHLTGLYRNIERVVKAGKILGFTSHEQGPQTKKGTGEKMRGGPKLVGGLPEEFCGRVSIILRTVYDEQAAALSGYPAMIWSQIRPDWIARDRTSTFPDSVPLDLLEGLLAAEYDVSYPDEMTWALEGIDNRAKWLLKQDPDNMDTAIQELKDNFWAAVKEKKGDYAKPRDARHVKWALRASINRALIRRAMEVSTF